MKTPGNYFKGLIVAVLLFFPIMVLPQQYGWRWQNPYLQGNDLNSIVMNGSVGWAVGDLGTVIHTTNDGLDWELVDLGTTQTLNCIYLDEISGIGWIVGNNGTIFNTSNAGESWSKQYSGTTEILYSVSAIGGECPWICGNNVILRSYDHGETWEWVNCIFHTGYYAIDHKNCNEIWISGKDGLVINTTDEGLTWQSHITPATYNLYSVDIVENGDYRACGHQNVIIRSSDGGETWAKENETTFLDLYNVDTRGIAGPAYAVGSKGTILETLDGGANWTQKASGTIYELSDVTFQAISHRVYVAGWYGMILRKEESPDAEFEILNERPVHWMQSADFIDENEGWVVGGDAIDLAGTKEGIILHTSDGGITWTEQLAISEPLNGVDFINENEGWAVGTTGTIKHTSNGGMNWATQTSPLLGSINSVSFVDENNGWIVSKDNWGEIAHTANGGSTWTKQTAPTSNPLVDVFFINADKGWAVGMDSTVLRTTDGGQTWLRCDLVVSNNFFFRSVYFIDEMKGWTAGIYGAILLTEDGGITWQQVTDGLSETLNSIFFIDPENGWAVGDAGTILRSIDGGYTWFKQYSGVSRNFLTSVNFVSLRKGWVTGEGGTIKRTENGGFWNEPGTFLRNHINLPIYDLTETRDTLIVDATEMRADGYELVGLEVMIDSILHPRASDLEIYLSHEGITETLVYRVNDQGPDFLWTRLTDEASIIITEGAAPFSGNHKPFNSLSAFNGLDPDGEWILTIFDSQTGHTGTLNAWGLKPLFEKTVSVKEPVTSKEGTQQIQLFQNIPNPFSENTEISWKSGINGFTALKVYNIHGQEIATLMNKFLPKGEYSVEFNRSTLSAGVYYYKLQVDNYVLTKKCIIL